VLDQNRPENLKRDSKSNKCETEGSVLLSRIKQSTLLSIGRLYRKKLPSLLHISGNLRTDF